MTRRSAISRLVRPSATRSATSRSRGLRAMSTRKILGDLASEHAGSPRGTEIRYLRAQFSRCQGRRTRRRCRHRHPGKEEGQMEAQKTFAQVPQSVVLAVLLATLLIGGLGGYAVRASEGGQPAGSERTRLIPRPQREGVEIT